MKASEAPLKLFFLSGAAVLAVAALAWAGWLWGGAGPGRIDAVAVHALAMSFGFFPMFFAGFLYSRGLRWLQVPDVPLRTLAPAAAAHGLGWGAVAAAVVWPQPRLLAGGLALAAVAWLLLILRYTLLLRSSRAEDRLHPALIVVAGLLGAVAMGVGSAAAAFERWPLVVAVARASVWGYVGLTFLAAAHRMIPFVSAAPLGSLAVVFAANAAVALLPALQVPVALLNALAGTVLIAFALRWPFVQSLRPRMLRMLYTGFAWLGASLLLSGIGDFGSTAPLHAYTMGFLGTTMLAMLSRVAAAAAGRAVVVDTLLWWLFLLLQAAVVFRVTGTPHAIGIAAVLWALVWAAWSLRYGALLLRK